MRRDNPRDDAALSRYWDRIVGDLPSESTNLTPDLTGTIDTLLRLDRAPEPRPAFVEHLENELMTTATANRVMPSTIELTPAITTRNGRTGTPPRFHAFDHLWPRQHRAGLAAAVVVLLTLAGGILAYRLAPSSGDDDPNRVALNAPPPATPVAANQPGPDECQISPAPLERLALAGTPSVEAAVHLDFEAPEENWGVSLDDLPSGEAVDDETLAAITVTVREFIACESADDPARASALFTDDYWRRLH